MDLQNEDWKEVIANKPDWARFITRDGRGLFEYHQEQPQQAGFGDNWVSYGCCGGYYHFKPECLDLSTIQAGNNFMQGGVSC